MKYKEGDTVRVKSKAWFDAHDKNGDGDIDLGGLIVFDSNMDEFLGLEAKITEIHGDVYYLDIDNKEWLWQDWMLEDSTPRHTIQRRKFSPINRVIY